MNVSAVTSSALEQIIEELEQEAGASSSSTATDSTLAATSASFTSLGEEVSPSETSASNDRAVTQDLVDLLKSLASGDTSAAKANLKKLVSDVTSDDQIGNSTTNLAKAISSMSKALESGNTSDALSGLANYLITTGLSTGNLVNTAA
jgi:hypothetical protein